MFCPRCGARNDDGAKFCKACGAPMVSGAVGTPAQAPATAPVSGAGPVGPASTVGSLDVDPQVLRIVGIACAALLLAFSIVFPVVKTNDAVADECSDALEAIEKADFDSRTSNETRGITSNYVGGFSGLATSLEGRQRKYNGNAGSIDEDAISAIPRTGEIVMAVGVVLGVVTLVAAIRNGHAKLRLVLFALFVVYGIVGIIISSRLNGMVSSAVTSTIALMASGGASVSALAAYTSVTWVSAMPGAILSIALGVVGAAAAYLSRKTA